MPQSWITLHPSWFSEELKILERHYPQFYVDQKELDGGQLVLYGDLKVRPSGGTIRYPVKLRYPAGTPFEFPLVTPLEGLPTLDEDGNVSGSVRPRMFDHRHQMPVGTLCLFQRETRNLPGGDVVRGIDALRRAEQWFLGIHTGHWPPDSVDSELEAHFRYATDVLMGQAFFRSEIEGYGQFFLIPDLRRIQDRAIEVEGICPYIATALTKEDGVVQVIDSRDDLSRLYPWIANEAWDSYRIAQEGFDSLEEARAKMGLERGYWWSLPVEPKPFHNGEGLLRELASAAPENNSWQMLQSALKGELSAGNKHFIGLRFPGRDGTPTWLIVLVLRQRSGTLLIQNEQKRRTDFERAPVYCVRVNAARPSDLNLRNTGVIDDSVGSKTVALIGLGALGSKVAELLAQAGVGHFRLMDMDRLATGNVARHVGGLMDFGAPKVRVVMARLLEINPYLTFEDKEVVFGSAVGSLDDLSDFIKGSDLTISTMADESVESVVNEISVLCRKPTLYGRALRKGSVGRVFLVRPSQDACKACLAGYANALRSGQAAPKDWIEIPEDTGDVLLHECGRPIIAASAVDLSFTASLIARVAIDFLQDNIGSNNHWVWTRSALPEVDSRLEREYGVFTGSLMPDEKCSICQEPDVVEVKLTNAVKEQIISMTEASPEVETGGVLIGYVDENRCAVVLRITGPGPKAVHSPTRFERDVEFVQVQLEKAAEELGDQGLYIGEWHSHLEADPNPSSTDIRSLIGISTAPNYLTRCPVLLIAGYDSRNHAVRQLKTWSFPVGGRFYTIEHKADSSL